MVLCGWGGSAGQLVWVPWRPIWSGSLQGLGLRDQRAAGHAPLGSFLIQSQDQEDLHLGVDLAHRFRRAPTELEEFPQFLEMWKTETSYHHPPNSPD